MGRKQRSWRVKAAMLVGGAAVAAALMFGSFGEKGGPLGTGQQRVTAQPSGTFEGQTATLQPANIGPIVETAAPVPPTAAQMAAFQQHQRNARAGMNARVAALPASDPRVQPLAPPDPNTQSNSRMATAVNLAAPGALADGDATFFHSNQLNPGGAGLSSSPINEPSVAQNGKYVFETWNWGAARSITGGDTWTYISPYATMADFCCDQDVIYDKGRDRMFWLRQGVVAFGSPAGGSENRDLITVDTGAGAVCTYDFRPSGIGLANSWYDYPRLSLSDNFLYVGTNVFNSSTNGFTTHAVLRIPLTAMTACGSISYNFWTFAAGWSPALVENARETMFMGDQIVTSSGLNDQFRVYWIFDDSTTLNFVDRTIAPYTFTNGNASCPVPGGFNPCGRADQRIVGGVIQHNTPSPQGLGATGDRVDFYWNVAQGNGFALPYTESASFHGGTVLYQLRKFIWNAGLTFFYAAASANDRDHVGISLFQFNPVASGANPYHLIGIDDDYNGNPPGWELYVTFASASAWNSSTAGDYLRSRKHAPSGTAWVASSVARTGAGQFVPGYTVFGRARDLNGFNRFNQQ